MLLNCVDNVLGPLNTVHAPVPTEGAFPDSVAVPLLQIDWVEPLVAVVGVPTTVTVNEEDELTQLFAFFTVRLPVYVPAAVLAGTLMVIGLAGNAASVTVTKLLAGEAFQVML